MKKTYQKPVLFAESFRLVDCIAANCGKGDASMSTVHPYQSATACTYTDDGLTIFTDSGIGCDMSWYDEEIYQGDLNAFISDMQNGSTNCYNAFSSGSPFLS